MNSPVLLDLDHGPHSINNREFTSTIPFVASMQLPDSPLIMNRPYTQRGGLRREEVILSPEKATRLGSFFMQCYVRLPRSPTDKDFDCHSFVAYMVNVSESPYINDQNLSLGLDQTAVNPRLAEPHTPYGFVSWQGDEGQNIHSVLALPDGKSMSVRGMGQPLVFADNQQLMSEYGAQTMHRLIPPAQ